MKHPATIEILCPVCGRETFLKRTPAYDGFRRVGETLSCAVCRHVFENEAAVPFKTKRKPAGFSRADLPPPPKVLRPEEVNAEISRLCRHCRHYVVNPFLQRCGLNNRVVEATDTCARFEARPPEQTSAPESGKAGV